MALVGREGITSGRTGNFQTYHAVMNHAALHCATTLYVCFALTDALSTNGIARFC
ncbi:hypothetical protein VTI74DRAFT_8226 [Chaetomium olivicolor]